MTSTPGSPVGSVPTQLNELLQHLQQEASVIGDRRLESRCPTHAPATLGVMVGQPRQFKPLHRGWITDLSCDGIGILLPGSLPVGDTVFINLESLAGRTLILPMKVIYCQQIMPQTYRIGGSFLLDDESSHPIAG